MTRKALLASVIFGFTTVLLGADAWIIRFRTDFMYSQPPCYRVQWLDEVLFHNLTSSDEVVRLIDGTSGTNSGTGTLTIPAGRTRSTTTSGGNQFGTPFGNGVLVTRLDVPDGVTIASRAGVFGPNMPTAPCDVTPSANNFNFGSLPLPVIRQLVPANQAQVHMGSDLGVASRHTNVILFNGGTQAATATVEYRVACTDRLIESRSVALQPNTVSVLVGFSDSEHDGCSLTSTADTTRYVVVTMDQPGFSHVMTVSNEFPTPTIGVTSASGP